MVTEGSIDQAARPEIRALTRLRLLERRLRAAVGLSMRRQWLGLAAAIVTLPLATALLAAGRGRLSQAMLFLLYLSLVVALAAVGGPVVGLISAAAAFLLVNWFFIEPLHTLNVADAERVAELIIFLAVSGTVAALVSTANRRTTERDDETARAEQLRATNELRSALLRAVSHDLRTPLASVKIATSGLRATDVELSDDVREELIVTADIEIDRLIHIVENLLDASRLQTGVVTPSLRPLRLADAVDGAAAALPSGDRGRVEIALDEGLTDVVADQALLERVIANLLSNAIAADPLGNPRVEASAIADSVESGFVESGFVESGFVELRVVDSGPGIPLDRREAVFEAFQRFSDRSQSGGLGLGLAICAGFCEAMSIDLSIADTAFGGTTIKLKIPTSRGFQEGDDTNPDR